ncbi:hypothetical protein Tco_0652928 [Tanacetum coccineum]|uniref:Uncharacterized protein n=1 Tax=Tanacetum coccineum TaxID=301880 RepID=A0ABQ4WZ13_9ASTR
MVTRFDRLDLVELYNLVMTRFETTTPEGVDLVLWGDLRTMFDTNAEDELWQNQERWNLKSWDLYENCSVHTLILEDGLQVKMLILCLDSFKSILISIEAMMEVRRIFKCWFYHHTTNGHQFTMSNKHQELASPEQTASGKDFSNPLIADSLLKTIWFSTRHASHSGYSRANDYCCVASLLRCCNEKLNNFKISKSSSSTKKGLKNRSVFEYIFLMFKKFILKKHEG